MLNFEYKWHVFPISSAKFIIITSFNIINQDPLLSDVANIIITSIMIKPYFSRDVYYINNAGSVTVDTTIDVLFLFFIQFYVL